MSLMQDYSTLLSGIAEQHENWSVTDDSPLTITRQSEDNQLPLAISVYGSDTKAHLFFNLYNDDTCIALAKKVLQAQKEDKIQKKDDDSGLVIVIDSDGFAVAYDVTEVSQDEFTTQFDSITETADHLLMQIVDDAYKTAKKIADTLPGEAIEQIPPPTQQQAKGIEDIIKQYFDERGFTYKHDDKNQRFIFGLNTNRYTNRISDQSLQIVIDYSDNDLLRIVTPWLYEFDLKTTEYSLIASVVAWFQFQYKFLSMSLDPYDGELKISIDIPRGQGVIHTSQIKRIVSFILQFTESTYDELFKTLLTDGSEAHRKLTALIGEYRTKVANHRWFESIGEKLNGISDKQKEEIEAILARSEDENNNSQDGI